MEKTYIEAKKLVDQARNVLVISHRKPDPDTLGAAVAMRLWLGFLGKNVGLACVDKPGRDFDFLPCIAEFKKSFELADFDLVVIVDAGASYMTDFHLKYEDLFSGRVPIINIDHHASNDYFGKVNIVDPQAASTTVIIYRMMTALGVVIDADIATALLTGIYGDTGSFMHSNTDGEVYKVAADLLACGAAIADISRSLFSTKKVSTLKLWGKVLEKAQLTEDNVVMSVIREGEYDDPEENPEQLSGVIDYLSMVPNAKFAVLLNEDRKGNVKGSFRTRKGDIDVAKIAAVFGGGGHAKASGFMLPGRLEQELRYKIVSSDMSKKSLDF